MSRPLCCYRGDCGNGPLRHGEGVECMICLTTVHPICSCELKNNANRVEHDGRWIYRRQLSHMIFCTGNWTICNFCATNVLDSLIEQDAETVAETELADNDGVEVRIEGGVVCHYLVASSTRKTADIGITDDDENVDNEGTVEDGDVDKMNEAAIADLIASDAGIEDDMDADVMLASLVVSDTQAADRSGEEADNNNDDTGSGEGDEEGVTVRAVAVPTVAAVAGNDDDDDDESEEVNGGPPIPDEEDNDVLSREEVLQKVSAFLKKVKDEIFKKGKYGTLRKSSAYAQILRRIKPMLVSGTFMTKHIFWYEVRKYFTSEASFLKYLDRLGKEIGVSCLTQLNLVPDPSRGSWVASAGFKLSIDGSSPIGYTKVGGVYCHSLPNFLLEAYGLQQEHPDEFDPDPEAEPERSTIEVVGDWKPKFIVTLEKKGWMKILVSEGILKEEDIIIVATQGYPTRNILACVHFLHRCFPDTPIVHGGDVGPIAVDVMLRFDYMKSTQDRFRVPVKWGFLLPSDVFGKEDVENALSGSRAYFGDRDRQADARVRLRDCMLSSLERMEELNLIRDAGIKYDMDGFNLAITGSLKDFVLDRLRNERWI